MSEGGSEPSVRTSTGTILKSVFGGLFGVGIFGIVAAAEITAEPQRQLAVATLEQIRVGDPTAASYTRDDLAIAMSGRPSVSSPALAIVRSASSFSASWNTTVSYGERCVPIDAYGTAGRTRLYVAMREDASGWALTAITTDEPDTGVCASD